MPALHAPHAPLSHVRGGRQRQGDDEQHRQGDEASTPLAQMEMDMSIGCGRWYSARRQGAGDRAAGPGRAAGSKGEQR